MLTRKANGQAVRERRERIELNDEDLKLLRREHRHGLSRRELADLIAARLGRPDFSEKSVSRCESGRRVQVTTLFLVSQGLRMSFDETWTPDDEDDPRQLLDDMRAFDKRANYAKAEEIGEHLRGRTGLEADLYSEICIAAAIARDHDGRWEEGLNLLDRSLAEGRIGAPFRPWAQYQLCVLRRNYVQNLLDRTFGRITKEVEVLLSRVRSDLQQIKSTNEEAQRSISGTFEDEGLSLIHILSRPTPLLTNASNVVSAALPGSWPISILSSEGCTACSNATRPMPP